MTLKRDRRVCFSTWYAMCFAFPFHVFWKQQENAELKIATIRMREIAKSQFLSFLFELNQLGNFPEVGEGGGSKGKI